MLKSILAIIAAALCTVIIIAFVPAPAPAAAAGTPQLDQRGMQAAANGTGIAVLAAQISDARGAACAGVWPYYERSCVRDDRKSNGARGAYHSS